MTLELPWFAMVIKWAAPEMAENIHEIFVICFNLILANLMSGKFLVKWKSFKWNCWKFPPLCSGNQICIINKHIFSF